MQLHTLKITVLGLLGSLVLAASASAAPVDPVSLSRIGGTTAKGAGGAEIAAYYKGNKHAYVTNAAANKVDIYDLTNPAAPAAISSIDLALYGATPNSVAVSNACGGRVAVAVEASPKTSPGKVVLFDKNGGYIDQATVGAQPDMITTAGTSRFVTANEGEPSDNGAVDPDGTVSVIDLTSCSTITPQTIGLGSAPLQGPVRIYGPGATQAANLEPEYVAISAGGRLAHVTLQENNAIAIIDLKTLKVLGIKALGYKNLSLAGNGLDPSDKDSAAAINTYNNVYGMYQPDAIAAYTIPGYPYPVFITANEGDSRSWSYFTEDVRAKTLSLDPTAFPAAVKTDAKLGRLTVTNTQGDTDGDGDFDKLYALGGRSVSVVSAWGDVAWDSGDDLEQYVAANDPTRFNAEGSLGAFDTRSDNKGPEPEGVTIGHVGSHDYAFVGTERLNGIFAMDLSATPGQALIAGYKNQLAADESPEGMSFIPAADSPNGQPLVLTANEVSGTLGIYAVTQP